MPTAAIFFRENQIIGACCASNKVKRARRGLALSWADECKIDPQVVAGLYLEHADALRRFVVGVLGNRVAGSGMAGSGIAGSAESAADVLHATFAKLVEHGHTVREEGHKSWLFSVAYHEALALRRRRAVEVNAVRRIAADGLAEQGRRDFGGIQTAEERLIRWETVERVRRAIEQLPAEQRQVVRMRITDQKKFAEIARELQLPLGTVLSRMQLALAKLRKSLADEQN